MARGKLNSAHAADDALTLLRIHRRTLYKARAACKMVCEVYKGKVNFENQYLKPAMASQ